MRALKAGSGEDIDLCGGSELASCPAREELIDELVMGTGIPLFAPSTPSIRLSPLERKPYDSGVVLERFAIQRAQGPA